MSLMYSINLKSLLMLQKNVIDFLNKHITQIIKGNKAHTQNNAYAKSAISINKVHIKIILLVILGKKHIKNYLKMCLSK